MTWEQVCAIIVCANEHRIRMAYTSKKLDKYLARDAAGSSIWLCKQAGGTRFPQAMLFAKRAERPVDSRSGSRGWQAANVHMGLVDQVPLQPFM
nr:hypothetical protein CFP56_54507 [Quercus suber]